MRIRLEVVAMFGIMQAGIFFGGSLLAQSIAWEKASGLSNCGEGSEHRLNPSAYTSCGWTIFGLNNIYAGTLANTSALIAGHGQTALDVSNNYWGQNIDPNTSDPGVYWPQLAYTSSSVASQSTFSNIECGGLTSTKVQDDHPTEVETYDTCKNVPDLCEAWSGDGAYDLAFDTIKYYIAHCYSQANPKRSFADDLGGCAGRAGVNQRPEGLLEYKKWLISTLALRSDDDWFCWNVYAIGGVFGVSDTRPRLSVLKFLIDNSRCSALRTIFGGEYASERENQIFIWQDTAKNNNMIYFDSTLPSFHELGLDSVLKYAASSGIHYEAMGSQIIENAHVTINPFQDQTALSLDINREAYLHIGVFDLLGNAVKSAGYEGVFETGTREVPLDLNGLPSGTYYLRISTANNEVRTIKLIKE